MTRLPAPPDAPKLPDLEDIDRVRRLALMTVRASSARIYGQTYDLWVDWCTNLRIAPTDVLPENVQQFLIDQPVTKVTRKRYLSALRKLAFVLSYKSPLHKMAYDIIERMAVPEENLGGKVRDRRALAPNEIERVLAALDEDGVRAARNRALFILLAVTGLRRAEAASLRWADIDFKRRVLFVRSGKGDQPRDVTIVGRLAIAALREWQMQQGQGREYVFCAVHKGDHVGRDAPIGGQDVYNVVREIARRSGVTFKPHDLRRTFITEGLRHTSVHNVQVQVGHRRPETTLLYTQAVDAEKRHKEFDDFDYG